MLKARRGSPEKKSVSPRYIPSVLKLEGRCADGGTNVFEVLQKIGDGITLAIGEYGLVKTIAGFT